MEKIYNFGQTENEVLDIIEKRRENKNFFNELKVADISIDILKKFSNSSDPTLQSIYIVNRNIYDNDLENLILDFEYGYAALSNPKATNEFIMKILEKYPDNDIIKTNLSKYPNTQVEILNILSKDKNEDILCDVAKNKNTDIEILKKLSKYKNPDVLVKVIQNRNTTPEMLDELSKNENKKVINAIIDRNLYDGTLKGLRVFTENYSLGSDEDTVYSVENVVYNIETFVKNLRKSATFNIENSKGIMSLGVMIDFGKEHKFDMCLADKFNIDVEKVNRTDELIEKYEEYLKSQVVNEKIIDKNLSIFKLPQNKDNENLFLFLKSETNIRKSEIINFFEKEQVFESEDKKAIFPLKDKAGNIVGGFEIDIYKGEKEAKLIENSDLKNVALKDVEYTKSLIEYIVEDIEEQKTLENVSEQEI